MVTLTAQFNAATVKKGETFRIDLNEGGFVGAKWDLEVVSGKAKLVKTVPYSGLYGLTGRVFEAQDGGDIEIVAKGRPGGAKHTFKIKVA